jgi:kynurenine formamidase
VLIAVLVLVVVLLVAGAVLAFAAFPHRSRPIPGAPARVSEAAAHADERLQSAMEAPAHGLLDSRERQQRASARFERVEERVVTLLRVLTLKRRGGSGGPAAARDDRRFESAGRHAG